MDAGVRVRANRAAHCLKEWMKKGLDFIPTTKDNSPMALTAIRPDLGKLSPEELSAHMREVVRARYDRPNPIKTWRLAGKSKREISAEMRRMSLIAAAKLAAKKKESAA